MQVIHLHFPFTDIQRRAAVAAIGYFDGVHYGHQGVIRKAVERANERNVQSALITFHPHPREIIRNEVYSYITPLPDKIQYVEQLGIEVVYVIHFTTEVSNMPPKQFIEQVLLPLGLQEVVIGFDFRFGRGGSGDAHTLAKESNGQLVVHIIEPIKNDGNKISSSHIREKLLNGEVEEANEYLSRPYTIRGTVVDGRKMGRQIGFPTANLALQERYFLPKNGVYGVVVHVQEQTYFGVMNIGIKPTLEQNVLHPTIEVHILNLSQEIYGEEVAIEILFYIREEKKFSDINALTTQISKDILFAKEKFVCYTV